MKHFIIYIGMGTYDFTLAGTEAFVNEVIETVSQQLTVSKIERDNF